MINLKINYHKTNSFNIKKNGIQVIENNSFIEIYNDPFCTIPVFITKIINKISYYFLTLTIFILCQKQTKKLMKQVSGK